MRQDGLNSRPLSKEITWAEWIDREVRKRYVRPNESPPILITSLISYTFRTKLGVYCFLNLQCLTFNVPPLILNSEIALDLPSDEDAWQAESEDLWQRCGRGQAPGRPSFQIALRSLLLGPDCNPPDRQPAVALSQDTSPCSTFGMYALLHGIIQHQYQLRQYSDFTPGPDGAVPPDQIVQIERGLRYWQQAWERNMEASLGPQNAHGPLAFNCIALIRIAYIRLDIDLGSACAALQSGDPQIIARAMKDQKTVARGPRLTKAALHACHALLVLAKEGIDLVTHTQVFVWSIQHSIASFQCCIVLVKWLETVIVDTSDPLRSDEESWLIKLVQNTLGECNVGEVENVKTLNVMVLRTWAKVFAGTTIWEIMPVIGAAFEIYADMLSR